MAGEHLDVEKLEAALAQMSCQEGEGDLGAVAEAGEHRFAGEEAADGHAIDAAGKLRAAPDLDAMGPAKLMQFFVGGDHGGGDPGALFAVRAAA